MVITLLHQNQQGQVPDVADLQAWSTAHVPNATHPLLADPGHAVGLRWAGGQPRHTLLAPGMVIVSEGGGWISDAAIEAALPVPAP